VLSTAWLKRIPSVVSLDATPIQYDALGRVYGHTPGAAWLERVKWQLNRDCFRAARHLVTWSAWAKKGLVDEYEVPAEKVTVIPPGVHVREWLNPRPRVLHDGPVKILFVGGDFERKGGLLLLEAFRAVQARGCLFTPICSPIARHSKSFITVLMCSACQPMAIVCQWYCRKPGLPGCQ
jgi:glycosyltransferase involved in cell wall biosynthesis